MNKTLTKTKILYGHQCQKRLWFHCNLSAGERQPFSLSAQRLIRQGREVERHAREKFPNGKTVPIDSETALAETQSLMESGADCLFQAAFAADGILVRCDILRKNGDKWDIVEVKSSTKVKDEHIEDLAVQWHVLESAGIPLANAFLMLVNSSGDCVYPDLSDLIWEADITADVRESANTIAGFLSECEKTLDMKTAPDIQIGKHCSSPQECPFIDKCWERIPTHSFDTIPRLGWAKKEDLIARGKLHAADADVKLTENQRRYVGMVQSGRQIIDRERIRARLSELAFPVHFLDFETLNPAIPRFDGMRPYGQFPFQFSCHILRNAGGEAEHREYLHPDTSDPRRPLLSALLNCLGEAGSVVVYHKAMEAGVLEKGLCGIADQGQENRLRAIQEQLWDLENVFKDDYLDPKFLGSTSMKRILPVIAPDMAYGKLRRSPRRQRRFRRVGYDNPRRKELHRKSARILQAGYGRNGGDLSPSRQFSGRELTALRFRKRALARRFFRIFAPPFFDARVIAR